LTDNVEEGTLLKTINTYIIFTFRLNPEIEISMAGVAGYFGNRDVGSNATLNAGDKDRGGGGEVMGG